MSYEARGAVKGKPTYYDFGDPMKHLLELVLDIFNLA
jgi:hypothetical protein